MKYIDRMGNVTVEENDQDKLLRHLYNDRGGRLCLRVLVSPWISKMAGRLLNTGFSARFVGDFVEKNRDFLLTNREKSHTIRQTRDRGALHQEYPVPMPCRAGPGKGVDAEGGLRCKEGRTGRVN